MSYQRRLAVGHEEQLDARPPPSVGRSTLTQRHLSPTSGVEHAKLDAMWVQRARDVDTGLDDASVQRAAAHGVAGGGSSLPHLETIQRAFGPHDVSGVRAHVGGEAAEASRAMGAHAYATGNDVAFAESSPSLFLVAHEAAHVVQQRAGVSLKGAVGQAGDSYEQHADAVASRVVAGESAADLLGPVGTGGGAAVQRVRDERFGEGDVAANKHGRIIKVSVVDGRTRIGIGLGHAQGVRMAMEGYVVQGDGMLADFQIDEVHERVAYAFVAANLAALQGHDQVVINPPSLPKKASQKDMHARVIMTSIVDGQTRITIGFGSNHGARFGMKGRFIGPNGKNIDDFVIDEERPGVSLATVHATLDMVRAAGDVVLNPST